MDNIFHQIILKVQMLAFFPTYSYIRKSIHHPALQSPSTTKTHSASRFHHDPLGQRIEKRYYLSWAVPEQRTITYYVRDAQGNVMATYSREVDEWMPTDNYRLEDWTLYGSSRLGLVKGTEFGTLGSVSGPEWQVTLSFVKNRVKQYELTNHLGNVLAIVSGEKDYLDTTGTGTWSYSIGRVLNAQDYYPFGMLMPGRQVDPEGYRFGFNGFEKDDEIKGSGNHLSFGDYGYDTRLVRRWQIDPETGKMPSISPYVVFNNNPIYYIDPDGESPISVLAKLVAKQGFKSAIKKYAKEQIEDRMKAYMSRNMMKQFAKDLDEVLETLDNSWWETAIELVPVAGDLYGASKFGVKVAQAYEKLQDLENKYVEKVYKLLPKDRQKEFRTKMRNLGVNSARKDQKEGVDGLGIKYEKNKKVDGHHKEEVKDNPDKMSDPRNIEFMEKKRHIELHKKK